MEPFGSLPHSGPKPSSFLLKWLLTSSFLWCLLSYQTRNGRVMTQCSAHWKKTWLLGVWSWVQDISCPVNITQHYHTFVTNIFFFRFWSCNPRLCNLSLSWADYSNPKCAAFSSFVRSMTGCCYVPLLRLKSLPPSLRALSLPPSLKAPSLPPSR